MLLDRPPLRAVLERGECREEPLRGMEPSPLVDGWRAPVRLQGPPAAAAALKSTATRFPEERISGG